MTTACKVLYLLVESGKAAALWAIAALALSIAVCGLTITKKSR